MYDGLEIYYNEFGMFFYVPLDFNLLFTQAKQKTEAARSRN